MNEPEERPWIPRQLTDRYINLARENGEFNIDISCRQLTLFPCALILNLVSKHTVGSSTMNVLSAVTRRSGRNVSPLIM